MRWGIEQDGCYSGGCHSVIPHPVCIGGHVPDGGELLPGRLKDDARRITLGQKGHLGHEFRWLSVPHGQLMEDVAGHEPVGRGVEEKDSLVRSQGSGALAAISLMTS